jgi:hypothetical protein
MHAWSRSLVALAVVALTAACGDSSSPGGGSTGTPGVLTVTATPSSVVADGANTIAVRVEGATQAPISVSTTHGTFPGGAKAVQVNALVADLVLTTCDSRVDSTCVATTTIRASDFARASGQATVAFTAAGGGASCAGCAAAGCQGKVCDGSGHVCSATSPSTCSVCPGGGVEICNDGIDNDCDGLVDCADPDCAGKSCDPTLGTTFVCASGTCQCPGGVAEICNDGIDNDCNGKIDCADTTCQPSGGQPGKVCDARGNTCAAPAGGVSTCSVCSGNGGAVEQGHETSCSDGHDNDCDGLVDCADSDCLNQPCNPANPNYRCLSKAGAVTCTDATSLYSLVLTATRPAPYAATPGTRLPADGVAKTNVTATLLFDGTPIPGATVTLATSDPATSVTATGPTDPQGRTTGTFTSSAAGGTATVTGSYTPPSAGATPVTATIAVDMPLLGQVRLVSQQYSVLGVRFSGYQEKSLLTFQALDSTGAPYPAGLRVDFTHESQGTSFIGAAANCTAANPSVCTATAATDANGNAQILLTSGKVATVVAVRSSATAGGIPATATAGNIAIVGAKASGLHVSLSCSPKNVPAFTNDDCINSFYGGSGHPISCTAAFADRFNNVLGVATLATFKSEAGAAGPPSTTPQYDSTKPPSQQTGLGIATNFVAVNGFALPADVAPFIGEYHEDFDAGCGTRTHNPRDGLSTIIVAVNGEEGFVDVNANGVYDPGEPFIDQGEPFVDANDNGKYDLGEVFIDLNNNGVYDGPNGVWDANTVVWTDTRVVYTGHAYGRVDGALAQHASRWYTPPPFPPVPTPTTSFDVTEPKSGPPATPATSATVPFAVMDSNYNRLASYATYAVAPLASNVSVLSSLPGTLDSLGMSFTKKYCNAPEPPFTCAVGQAESACTTSPCYVVTDVGGCDSGTCNGFGYGAYGQSTMTGAKAGGETVNLSVTLNGVTVVLPLAGTVH